MLGPSSVPAHSRVPQGAARSVSLLHGPRADSCSCHLPIQRYAHVALQDVALLSLGRFSLLRGRGSRWSLGNAPVAGCTRSPKINKHCDCTPSPDQHFPQAKPRLRSTAWAWSFWHLGFQGMCSPNCWNYFPLDFLKHATVYQNDSVFTWFFFSFSADCLGNHSIQFPRISLLVSLLTPNQFEMNEKIYKKNVLFLMENYGFPDS